MKQAKQGTNAAKLFAALALAGSLAACGGGGGDGGDGGTTTPNPTPIKPTAQQPTDPWTGKNAAGTPTNQVTGAVVNAPTAGATISAYLVNPDGSNGAALGQATTDANGQFSMSLSQIPPAMVRFVASGGTFKSEADASVQKSARLELVAPFITTALSNFIITPVTDYASQRLAYLASKEGRALADAYNSASSSAVTFLTGNNKIGGIDQPHAAVDYVGIVPGSAQDTLRAYADALTAVEYYGVKNDLPSSVIPRLLAQSQLTGMPKRTDANGQAINVGQWVGGVFDETKPFTLEQLSMGAPSVDIFSIVLARAAADACASGDKTGFYARFPLSAGQSDYLDATGCTAYTNNISAIKAKIAANQRSK